MGLGNNQQQREFNTRTNQSCYGKPVPWVMGTAQVEQSIFWIDGFSSTMINPGKGGGGGGGKGGGKGGQYLYSADVVAGLCIGNIQGVANVWSGQSWLGVPTAAEQYTITSPYTYTPTNASTFNGNGGVGVTNTYSGSYSDLGSSGTTLSGSFLSSMTQVAYGTSLTTGLYSINPTGNVYHFSSADATRVVTVSYSYNVTDINRQENDIVPAGKSISVTGTGAGSTVNGDLGVVYTSTGVAFTRVASSSPSVTGTYYVSGSNPATYKFATGDVSALVTISFTVNDPNAIQPGETSSLNYTLQNGAISQSPYAFLTSDYPAAAFGYTGVATLLYQPMDLGMGSEVQENRFEVVTYDIFGGGVQDCNPCQCIYQVLTNTQTGLGVGTIPFPTACIDNGGSGTWGGASAAGASSVNSTAWNWFASQSFFISPVLDAQDTAASVMSKWLEAGMCAGYYSEGLLKLVPYGDTSAAGNGCTWEAPSTYVESLDDSDYVSKPGEDPIKISRISAHDAWNVVQVQWDNRQNQYAPEVTQESDQGLINRWGERREDVQNYDFIHTVTAATFAANMRLKHNAYERNMFEFTVDYTYSYLEPMDVIYISTTSVWAADLNNANLGIANRPVRITKVVDDPVKGLAITCEDYVFGAHQPVLYNKQLNESVMPANAYADPGNSEVVMFEATSRLTGFDGDQIWIGALGTSQNWGATNIWVSQTSGGDYIQVGQIKTPARLGTLDSSFSSGSDPDTTNSLVVDLAENCGSFEAGTHADADKGNTMCFVDGEIISYSTLTYTGQNQITMSGYIRRGQMQSVIATHATSSLFMRLDSAVFQYQYDPTWRGSTLYFKFQSVNAFGLMAQDLSSLTPVSFTVPGLNPGTVDASTGIVVTDNLPSATSIVIPNSNFEASTIVPPPGWQAVSAILSYDTSTQYSGTQSLKTTNLAQYGAAQVIQKWAVSPGQTYAVGGWINSDGTAEPYLQFIFFDKNLSYLGQAATTANTTTSWNYVTGTGTAPANTVYGVFQCTNGSASTNTVCEFDLVNCWYVPSLVGTTTAVGGINDGSSNFSATASTLTYRPESNPLSASDAGSNATVSIASFTMLTSSKGAVSVSSGSVTALSYSTLYYIYYDDATLAGGSVTFAATTTKTTAINDVGRFFVGSIVTPPATGSNTTGNNDGGVGAQSGQFLKVFFSTLSDVNNDAEATTTNSTYANDGSDATYAAMKVIPSGGSGGNVTLTVSVPMVAVYSFQSAALKIKTAVPTNGANTTTCNLQYSLDNGNTYTTVYSLSASTTRATTIDSISLSSPLNLGRIQVQAILQSGPTGGNQELDFYEAWIEVTS